MTDVNPPQRDDSSSDAPLYGVGPVTVRELGLVVIWLVSFVLSFFPIYAGASQRPLLAGYSVWTSGISWILVIGLPTVAVFLLVLRRFSPEGIRRVGSLGIDQFASVAFSVSAAVWFTMIWQDLLNAADRGFVYSWVVWVEFFLMLAGVVLTVLAPFIPPFAADFRARPDAPAHRNARPVRPVSPRPRAPRPAHTEPSRPPAHETVQDTTETSAFGALGVDLQRDGATDEEWSPPYARRGGDAGVQETAPSAPASASPFWALAPVEREVHDESGVPIFTVGPTAWALVIEDRGAVYVIQHEDGRIGYLHDVTDIRRG